MNPVIGLSLGRIAIGAVAVGSPAKAAEALHLDAGANPQVPYVLRLFGVREIALGLATLVAGRGAQRRVVAVGVAVDAADAATAYLALRDGSVSKRAAATLLVPALVAVGNGLLTLARR